MLPFGHSSVADGIGLAVCADVLLKLLEGRLLSEACTPLQNGRPSYATRPFSPSRLIICELELFIYSSICLHPLRAIFAVVLRLRRRCSAHRKRRSLSSTRLPSVHLSTTTRPISASGLVIQRMTRTILQDNCTTQSEVFLSCPKLQPNLLGSASESLRPATDVDVRNTNATVNVQPALHAKLPTPNVLTEPSQSVAVFSLVM